VASVIASVLAILSHFCERTSACEVIADVTFHGLQWDSMNRAPSLCRQWWHILLALWFKEIQRWTCFFIRPIAIWELSERYRIGNGDRSNFWSRSEKSRLGRLLDLLEAPERRCWSRSVANFCWRCSELGFCASQSCKNRCV
jgi:hypothetical protein